MVRISYDEALEVSQGALHSVGVPPTGAGLQADLLLDAELSGRPSHGLMRLPRLVERIVNGVVDAEAAGRHTWMGEALLRVDGQKGLGPVVATSALDALMDRVKRTGVAVASIHNNNHLGMLAWYARRVSNQGLALIALSTSEALVHPWGGRSALLGTNPIAIGVPTADRPFVLDMATSAISMGQIHDYAQRGERLKPGWALDANGERTTDADAAKSGSIAPFGEAKGYALGLAIEVLVVSLTASAIGRDVVGTLDSTKVCNKGDVFIAVDPGAGSTVADRISAYLDLVRASGPADGPGRVAVPGDRASASREQRRRDGFDVPDELWRHLRYLADGSIQQRKEARA